MKKIIILLLAVQLMLCACIPVFAANDSILVKDEADLLSEYDQSILQQKALQITNDYQIEIIILTVPTTNGLSARSYADQYYSSNDCGYGDDRSGILLLIAMDTPVGRGWSVVTYAEGYDILSDDQSEELMEDVIPLLSDGQYSNAFHTYLDQLETRIIDYRELTPDEVLFIIAIAILIGALAGLVTVLIMRAGMKTAVFQHGAKEYIVNGSYDLKNRQDIFLYSHVTKVRRSSDSSSGRSGSGRSGGSSGRF
jgi:uncharacterized protein